jgi:disease resistance protein RPM1
VYRYFIVIDDIWDIESWNVIRNGLDDNGMGSKIVLTTRRHDVAKEVGLYYKMEPLPYESSKTLFHTRIFGCEDGCPKDLSQVSEKFLKKCGGVPLAIITTSSLLANKSRNIKVWNEISDSIGSGLDSNANMDNMRKILSLSYYDLPSPLKTCLLYLSIFPEDYEIEKDRLIWKWIAEDFVQQGEESESLFEIGESYFNELLNRSLIQVANTISGTPWSCRVHDMVLELICSLSRQENFVTTALGDNRQRTAASAESKKVRRLSLQNNTAWPTMEMSKLRSIAIFSSAKLYWMPSLSCCHLLRVLDLQGCNLRDHPSLRFVGNLCHLRYLSLAQTYYGGELPVEIGKLQFLQTLDLWNTQINELPSSILGLKQLIYLCGNRSTRLPNGLRCLTLLEVLFDVTVDSACMAEELGHLTQLRRLYVRLKKDKDGLWDEKLCAAFVRSLAKLHKINRLEVESNDVAADLDGSVESLCNLSCLYINVATSLPTWISPTWLPLLSYLNITMFQVRTDDIWVLGMLQALRCLTVIVFGEVQVLERFAVSTDAFPCAIKCTFLGFSMAPSVFPHGAMPRLEQLSFSIRLEDFPGGKFVGDDLALGHLPSLQILGADLAGKDGVREEVVTEVKEKLRHEADAHPNKPNIRFGKYYF